MVGFEEVANGGDLGGVVLGEAEKVGAAEGGESGAGSGEGKDGDLSFLAELDHKVGLH